MSTGNQGYDGKLPDDQQQPDENLAGWFSRLIQSTTDNQQRRDVAARCIARARLLEDTDPLLAFPEDQRAHYVREFGPDGPRAWVKLLISTLQTKPSSRTGASRLE